MTYRPRIINVDPVGQQLDRICALLNANPEPPASVPLTRWQKVKAWFRPTPAEPKVSLEVTDPRVTALALVIDEKLEAVRHEAENMTERADQQHTDDVRYLGFCAQSTPRGTLVEVRAEDDDNDRQTMAVDDVGVDSVRVYDLITGDLSIHKWWRVRRVRQQGDAPDVPVPAPDWNKKGEMIPRLLTGDDDDE